MRNTIVLFSFLLIALISQISTSGDPIKSTARSTTLSSVNQWGTSGYTWAADFNGDGKADIASASGDNVYLYISTGVDFELTNSTVSDNWGSSSYTWVADFNGDGKADIASASDKKVYMNLSTGTGFNSATWTVPGKWGKSGYTWAADFNGDGKADIASASGENVYMNLSTGTAFTSIVWAVPGDWGKSDYTWVADFNFAGASDIASASDDKVYMNLSTGTGFASTTWTVPGNWGTSGYTWVADFNGDKYPDIASANGNAIYMSLSRGARFASETWHSSTNTDTSAENSRSNINSSVNRVPVLSSDHKQCQGAWGVGTWAVDFDKRRSLSWTMSLADLGYVKTVQGPSDITDADDGLYIFVLHREKREGDFILSLRIRRSDRPDDVGFAVQGLKQYSYKGNIPCPNLNPKCVLDPGEKPETPNQFVRHTQLNQGVSLVASAGQLQIRKGQIIWINNASGHFAPGLDSLDCVEVYLDVLKIPRAKYNFKRDRSWNHWLELKDEL